jgi:hypothetical protein
MSQEDFGNFVNNYDGWTCVICREGDGANDSRTLHECLKHEFHTKCLEEEKRRDIRCPICRFTSSTTPITRTLSEESFIAPTSPIARTLSEESFTAPTYIHHNNRILAEDEPATFRDERTYIQQLQSNFFSQEADSQSYESGGEWGDGYPLRYTSHRGYPNQESRLQPLINKDSARGLDCVWCNDIIRERVHYRIKPCKCRMHSKCLLDNLHTNGINRETREAICVDCTPITTSCPNQESRLLPSTIKDCTRLRDLNYTFTNEFICDWCGDLITSRFHYIINPCRCRIHGKCLLENFNCYGMNQETGNIICTSCAPFR